MTPASIIFHEKNQAPQYFFRKKSSASLLLQKQVKRLIISSDKNRAPRYFFGEKSAFSFSEEIMRHSTFFLKK
jgi:hypothetical protein